MSVNGPTGLVGYQFDLEDFSFDAVQGSHGLNLQPERNVAALQPMHRAHAIFEGYKVFRAQGTQPFCKACFVNSANLVAQCH
jgi:hypothetical protein